MSRSARVPPHASGFLRQIVDSLPGMIAYWDRDLVCRYANQAYFAWFKREPATLVGITMRELLGPALFDENRPCVAGALRGERQTFVRSVTKPDGSVAQAQATYVPDVDADGVVVGFYVSVHDVTEFKRVELQLRDREAALSHALSASNDAVARLELAEQVAHVGHWRVDYPGPLLDWSDEVYRIHGVLPATYVPEVATALAFYHPDDQARITAAVERARKDGIPYDERARLIRPSGETRYVRVRGLATNGLDGDHRMVFGALVDVTDQQRTEDALRAANERLSSMAHTDGLLGIPNRRRFDESFEIEWRSAARSKEWLSIALIDVDRFKAFNDRYGHQCGDECLKAIAVAVGSVLKRPKDLLARYGGEEFVLLLPSTDRAGAALVAERARAAVEGLSIAHLDAGDDREIVTVSVGVDGFLASGPAPAAGGDLLAAADAMLYRAKREGRNTVVSRLAYGGHALTEPDRPRSGSHEPVREGVLAT